MTAACCGRRRAATSHRAAARQRRRRQLAPAWRLRHGGGRTQLSEGWEGGGGGGGPAKGERRVKSGVRSGVVRDNCAKQRHFSMSACIHPIPPVRQPNPPFVENSIPPHSTPRSADRGCRVDARGVPRTLDELTPDEVVLPRLLVGWWFDRVISAAQRRPAPVPPLQRPAPSPPLARTDALRSNPLFSARFRPEIDRDLPPFTSLSSCERPQQPRD